jgi:sporulation protein YlmC with PRC-barrel domain
MVKRSRIISETKVLEETKYENGPDTVEKPTTDVTSRPIEELVAITSKAITELEVVNGQGEKLGKIEDLMIDLKSGRIVCAVLSFGGTFGLGNKFFAIPWELLCLDNKWNYRDIYRQKIVFNGPKEKLEKPPDSIKITGRGSLISNGSTKFIPTTAASLTGHPMKKPRRSVHRKGRSVQGFPGYLFIDAA